MLSEFRILLTFRYKKPISQNICFRAQRWKVCSEENTNTDVRNEEDNNGLGDDCRGLRRLRCSLRPPLPLGDELHRGAESPVRPTGKEPLAEHWQM